MRRIILTACLCCGMYAMAQQTSNGGWSPELGLQLTSELQTTGEGKFNFVNLLRLEASLPVNDRLSFDIASLSTCMSSDESIGKELQTFSNLDAGNIPFTLAVLGINWQINDHHTLFAGIRNMNEDYFCSPVTSLFSNSSWGIYPSLSCNYPIANYPLASVGLHYRYETAVPNTSDDTFAVQASVYNGVGYKNFSGRENLFRVCPESDGVFGLLQGEYNRQGSSYYLGACLSNTSDANRHHHNATSAWAYAEQQLNESFSLMAAYSHSFMTDASCSDFVGIGGRYTWRKCEFGAMTNYAWFAEGGESATELTCKVQLNNHFAIQPSLHLISTPDQSAIEGRLFQVAGTVRACLEF